MRNERKQYVAKPSRKLHVTESYVRYQKMNLNSPRPRQCAGGEIILLILDPPPIKCCIFSWITNIRVIKGWFRLWQITTRRCVWVVTCKSRTHPPVICASIYYMNNKVLHFHISLLVFIFATEWRQNFDNVTQCIAKY